MERLSCDIEIIYAKNNRYVDFTGVRCNNQERECMHMSYKHHQRGHSALSILMAICMMCTMLTGCDISSKHLEVTYEENDNGDITNWDDVTDDNKAEWDDSTVVTTWDDPTVVTTWNDVEDYSDWVYAEIVFDDVTEEYPIVECQVFDYKSNGKYFDGDKIYQMVGDKFDANSFVADYAVGTGVIVICTVITVVTGGISTPFACFIAGAADWAVSYAAKGAAFGAAMKAVSTAIMTGDLEETMYGALEGSAEGYKWGAIYGAITGGLNSRYCFTGDTPVHTPNGLTYIADITVGDSVMAYSEENGQYEYQKVTQIVENKASQTVKLTVNGETIESTPTHPYWNGSEWIAAGALRSGDIIETKEGFAAVESTETITYEEPITTYNLCVEESHSYLVGRLGAIVHNRCAINSEYAGKTKYLDDPKLAKKYPDGVEFTPDGYPDFSKYAEKTVKFDPPSADALKADTCLNANYSHDFAMANKAAGYKTTPQGYTWHHKEDMQTMQLIPTDLHQAVRHSGGALEIRYLLTSLL